MDKKKHTIDDLFKVDELWYLKSNKELFTGYSFGEYKGYHINGKRDGNWIIYYNSQDFADDEEGRVMMQGNYLNGKEHGVWFGYHDNGKLMYRWTYKNGQRHGTSIWCEEDGRLSSVGDYYDDKLQGYNLSYQVDGSIWEEETGFYENGKKIK